MSAKAKLTAATLAAALPLLLLLAPSIMAQAQTITGVVAGTSSSGGALSGFELLAADGERHSITVDNATEFGLENTSGERWVAVLGDDAANGPDALARMRDHQRRFAPVTAVVDAGGVASSVVEANASSVSSNLGYLLAAFAISWGGFFLYVFWVSRKQRFLQLELEQLRSTNEQ